MFSLKSKLSPEILNIKYSQILEYYNFHKNIELYFKEGFNEIGDGKIQKFYFIDSNWINQWKMFTNYDNVILNQESGIDYLINNNILNNSLDFYPSEIKGEKSLDNFLNNILYEIEDFEVVINESTYDLLKNYYNKFYNFFFLEVQNIEGIFYDKMLVLLIEKQKRIKIFYKGQIEDNTELIQINIDCFNINNNIANDLVLGIIDIINGDTDAYSDFKKNILKIIVMNY